MKTLSGIAFDATTSGMKLSDKLLHLRTERGLTIQQAADALGLHKTQYDRYEREGGGGAGTRGPTYERALALARYFKVPMEWLCDDEADWPPPVGATDAEQALWTVVKRMGAERALDRLMGADAGSQASPQSQQGQPGKMSLEPGPPRPRISRQDRRGRNKA